MIGMLPVSETRVLDINAEALGVDVCTLMGNAGAALAGVLDRYSGKKYVFVCGSGNNGGDGFAAAGIMENEDVTVCLMGPESSIRSEVSKKYFLSLNCPIIPFEELNIDDYEVLVDCALGTGTEGNIRHPYDEFVKLAKEFKGTVVSADIPTGLGCDISIIPDVTVSFNNSKTGMTEENSGEIIVADIGIPEEAYKVVGPGDMCRYPIPEKNSHKGQNGRLLIIGGGPYIGAPAMSGLSALRTGTDIVTIATPEKIIGSVASYSPIFTFHPLRNEMKNAECEILRPTHVPDLLKISNNYDAILIGPGLGIDEDTVSAVKKFVSSCRIPLVVDADAIGSLGKDPDVSVPAVYTPHRKEFEKLGGISFDEAGVSDVAASLKGVVLLKGREDIISDGKRVRINRTGTPAMTVAGTGDVLSGIVAGFLSKGMIAFDASCLGAYVCGKAGELAFETYSYGLMATDIIERIPLILKEGLSKL